MEVPVFAVVTSDRRAWPLLPSHRQAKAFPIPHDPELRQRGAQCEGAAPERRSKKDE